MKIALESIKFVFRNGLLFLLIGTPFVALNWGGKIVESIFELKHTQIGALLSFALAVLWMMQATLYAIIVDNRWLKKGLSAKAIISQWLKSLPRILLISLILILVSGAVIIGSTMAAAALGQDMQIAIIVLTALLFWWVIIRFIPLPYVVALEGSMSFWGTFSRSWTLGKGMFIRFLGVVVGLMLYGVLIAVPIVLVGLVANEVFDGRIKDFFFLPDYPIALMGVAAIVEVFFQALMLVIPYFLYRAALLKEQASANPIPDYA